VIFFSLLPMIVTPAGRLADPVLDDRQPRDHRAFIQNGPRTTRSFAQGLDRAADVDHADRLRHLAFGPFSFIVFYAGLQTLPEDTMEAARIDGATRWQQHALRGRAASDAAGDLHRADPADGQFPGLRTDRRLQARPMRHRCPGSSSTTCGGETQLSAAGATSVMTIIGVAILLSPVLVRTWRDFKGKRRMGANMAQRTIRAARLKVFSSGFIVLWLLIASFPFVWTLWGSFKVELDFFSRSPTGPTRSRQEHPGNPWQPVHPGGI
jgi:hypothetical protein